jgi:hypothetical protein
LSPYSFSIEQTQNGHRKCAFAGSALADQSEDFTALNVQVHLAEGRRFISVLHRDVRGKESVGLGFLRQDFVAAEQICGCFVYFTESFSTFQ